MILISLPSRARPDRCLYATKSLLGMASEPTSVYIKVAVDEDDPTLEDYYRLLEPIKQVVVTTGKSLGKVPAFNRDLPSPENLTKRTRFLIPYNDDLTCTHHGWDTLIEKENPYPNLDGVFGWSDGYNPNTEWCTFPVVGANFYRACGYLYNPIYKSLFADPDLARLARRLNRLTLFPKDGNPIPFRHDHPHTDSPGKMERDALYVHNDTFWASDKAIFERDDTGLKEPLRVALNLLTLLT